MHAAETGLHGAMNVTAPLEHATYGELLEGCRDVTGARAELVWADEDWLSAREVMPWPEIGGGAVQVLDLRLLVHGQDQGVLGGLMYSRRRRGPWR
jgi:hypothetical protein